MSSSLDILISFLLYLILMLAIGWYYYKRTKNLSDYILGGRKLNIWVTSLSAQASDMSGWLLLGLPGYAYLAGIESAWLLLGLLVGTYINWKFVAQRLRKYTQIAGDSITLPDYFQNRFRAKSNLLRIFSALFILIFFLIYTASGFVAGAKLFNTVFGLPYTLALAVGVFVIISYTFLGGFMAVSWTDVVQGSIMFFAIIIVPVLGIFALGGPEAAFQTIRMKNPEYINFFTNSKGSQLSFTVIVSLLAWGLGYFGQPHILARFMAIEHSSQIKDARKIAMTWVVISLFSAVILGMIGFAYLEPPLSKVASETVFMVMVHKLVSPIFAGALLSAILAAVMSTADSQLLVASSAFTEDLYRAFLRKNASQKELVFVGRIAVLLIAVLAFLIALNPNSSVLELVAYAWAGFGSAFGPVILFSLYWKKMTENGAIAGIVVGGLTVLIWKQLSGGLFDLYEMIPGFIFASLAVWIVSKLDRPPELVILDEFNSLNEIDV